MPIERIVALLDEEIARLQQVRQILAEVEPSSGRGKQSQATSKTKVLGGTKTPRKRMMSPEGRARIAAAQKARWAAQKKAAPAAKKTAK